MTTWITADTHYYHPNIIIYAKRPYIKPGDLNSEDKWVDKHTGKLRAGEMTGNMINFHNELVKPGDRVIHLGDFTFGGVGEVIRLLGFLKGNFEFVWGNHDQALHEFKDTISYYPHLSNRVKFLGNLKEINIDGQTIVLCHYAMRTWRKSGRGAWHLYGHSHGSLPDDPHSNSFDVGVDCHNLRPINMEQVKKIMSKKTFKPIDHHGLD